MVQGAFNVHHQVHDLHATLVSFAIMKKSVLVLDGDINVEWIESMKTVMDDNKTLTLASNKRIPMTALMRSVLEIENMREASQATVSRDSVIFMNFTDIWWMPFEAPPSTKDKRRLEVCCWRCFLFLNSC